VTTTTAINTATTAVAATTGAVTASQPLETYAAGRPDRGAARARAAELFHAHGTAVERLCRSLLRDTTEAEDALQQSFLSAYRSLLKGTEPRDPIAWLMTIARRECLLRIRRRMRDPIGNGSEEAAATLDTHAEAVQRSEVTAMWQELHALPQRQRDALLLREVQGLSYGELARELMVSEPAVESLLLRARRRLRGRLSVASLPVLVRGALERLVEVGGAAGGAKLATLPVAAKVVSAGVGAVVVAGVAFEAPRHIEHPAAAEPRVHVRHVATRHAAKRSAPAHVAVAEPVVRLTPERPSTTPRLSRPRAAATPRRSHRGRDHHGSAHRGSRQPAVPVAPARDHDSDETTVVAAPPVVTGGAGSESNSGEANPSSSGRDEAGSHDGHDSEHGGSGESGEATPTVTVATALPAPEESEEGKGGSPDGSGSGSDDAVVPDEEVAAPVTSAPDASGSKDGSGVDGSSSSGGGGDSSSGHGGSSGSGSSGSGSSGSGSSSSGSSSSGSSGGGSSSGHGGGSGD
jgi:RNA polymerase sigma factor (sigma-70 family)